MSATGGADSIGAWRRLIPGVVLLAALLLLFRDTAAAMVTIWIRSETFTHAFLVPPIVLWLVWRRRETLAALEPRPLPLLLIPIAAVCGLWLLGELASVNAATQFALVTLIVLSVPALFGMAITRELMFPLAFLYFSVPVGEFLVPTMMESTADVTVLALQWSGIPVYREGLQFVIPTGTWSIVQACSGVRYLIASFVVGTLFAYLNFRSTRRRVLFMAVSILVPIVANWVRAYMIVMLGHLSGNKLATGADHLVYGWVFFGIVIMLMFMIGARWSEPDEPSGTAQGVMVHGRASVPSGSSGVWRVAFAVGALLAGTQAVLWQLDHLQSESVPVVELPAVLAANWVADEKPLASWMPGFQNPSAIATRSYRSEGRTVGVWVGYYRHQGYDRKLVSSTNTLVAGIENGWAQVSSATQVATLPSGSLTLRTADLRASSLLEVSTATRLRVWQVYWIGGDFMTSDVKAKLRLAFDRLLGRGDDGAVILISTPVDGAGAADATLEAFVHANLDKLGATLATVRDAR